MERSAWPKNLSSRGKQAIKELLDGRNPTKKMRHLFDAHSQTGNNTAQPLFGEDLIVSVLGSFSNSLSPSSSAAESYEVSQVPTNACVRSEVSEGSESIHTPVPRRTLDTCTGLDQNLIDDGHQWSTYDQQSIPNFKLPERTSDSWTSLDQNLTAWRTYDQQSILNSQFPRLDQNSIAWSTEQVRVNSDTGLEGHPEDGFCWRKYGQKEILGAKFPRGYYRCCHRNVIGCLATKKVQRSDQDPTVFEVTYRGRHTCIQAPSSAISPAPAVEEEPQKDDVFPLFNFSTATAEPENGEGDYFADALMDDTFMDKFFSPVTSGPNYFSLSLDPDFDLDFPFDNPDFFSW